jgi:hypothetical protein
LAEDFNAYFLAKPQELRLGLLRRQPTVLLNPPSPIGSDIILNAPALTSFNFTTAHEVQLIIRNSPCKTCAIDIFPSSLLRKHLVTLLPGLTVLMNHVIQHGFPEAWKQSLVLPLLKKDGLNTEALANYRPVNQLPALSKIAEKLVCCRLTEFLETNGLHDVRQTGYRNHHSCEAALTYVTNYTRIAMDEGKVTLLIMLDLSAAFDCVDHQLLISSLTNIGISGQAILWLKSYLSGRSQRVQVHKSISPPLPVKFGVPQGSVLGPVLFIIFLSGLSKVISPYNIEHIIYADDIQLFIASSPSLFHQALATLEKCINDVYSWLTSMRLTLNENKSEFIIFGNKTSLNKCPCDGIKVGNVIIQPCLKNRNLGVMLDQTLKMDAQVGKIRSAAFARLRLIARVRRSLYRAQTTLLIKSLVISNITYCMPLLGGIDAKLLLRLQQVIHASVKLIHTKKKFDSINLILKREKWLPVQLLIKLRTLILLYSVLKYGKPTFLRSLIEYYQPTRSLRSDGLMLLKVPRYNLQSTDSAFQVLGPKLWNSLPLSVRLCTTKESFATQCTNFLAEFDM